MTVVTVHAYSVAERDRSGKRSGAGRKLSERERSGERTKLAAQISLKGDMLMKLSNANYFTTSKIN